MNKVKIIRMLILHISPFLNSVQYIKSNHACLILNSVSQAILYHLAELKGMSLWYQKFGVLGLTTQTLHTAIMSVGSFVLKSSELQQWVQSSKMLTCLTKNRKLRKGYVIVQEPSICELLSDLQHWVTGMIDHAGK